MRFQIQPKYLRKLKCDYRKFSARLREDYGVLCNAGFANDNLRFVTHRDVTKAQCTKAIKAVKSLVGAE